MASARLGILTLACVVASPVVRAQPPTTQGQTTEPPVFALMGDRVGKGIGVETSPMWPVHPDSLFHLRAALPVAFDGRCHLVFGAQGHVPQVRSEQGHVMSLAGQVGVCGYLRKGLHVDGLTTVDAG
jgi:hypothetical protein